MYLDFKCICHQLYLFSVCHCCDIILHHHRIAPVSPVSRHLFNHPPYLPYLSYLSYWVSIFSPEVSFRLPYCSSHCSLELNQMLEIMHSFNLSKFLSPTASFHFSFHHVITFFLPLPLVFAIAFAAAAMLTCFTLKSSISIPSSLLI